MHYLLFMFFSLHCLSLLSLVSIPCIPFFHTHPSLIKITSCHPILHYSFLPLSWTFNLFLSSRKFFLRVHIIQYFSFETSLNFLPLVTATLISASLVLSALLNIIYLPICKGRSYTLVLLSVSLFVLSFLTFMYTLYHYHLNCLNGSIYKIGRAVIEEKTRKRFGRDNAG